MTLQKRLRVAVCASLTAAGLALTGLSASSFSGLGSSKAAAATDVIRFVPTFESVGLYWAPTGQSASKRATVNYRVAGSATWKAATDMAFDGRAVGGRPAEYRSSIVGLTPATTYEVKLALAGTTTSVTKQFKTWAEKFPVASTIQLPLSSSKPLELSEIGSPTGYVLVTGPGGGPATIDVANAYDYNIRLTNSAYVILRGLTLKGAKRHGIQLGATSTDVVRDIVIEGNTISGWGTKDASGFGTNLDSAIFSDSGKVERIVIQGNTMKSPRTTANSWKQQHNGSYHPLGPQGITFKRGLGNHVIRYNDIVGDSTHHFNDGMGATANFSYQGFPAKDTDIYGNYIAYTWDDGIESEGSNMNVRIWDNYLTEVYHGLGLAPVVHGPLYAFRNVQDVSRSHAGATYGQAMFKMGGNTRSDTFYGDGKVYLFHNTVLKPTTGPQSRKAVEAGHGRVLRNAVTRNNIFQTGAPSTTASISDSGKSTTNSFDSDLYNGLLVAAPGAEARGIKGAPTHVVGWGMDLTTRAGIFAVASGSPGHDKGVLLPNINDGFLGAAPDMGAHEAGAPAKVYGAKGFRPAATVAPLPTPTPTPTATATASLPDMTVTSVSMSPAAPVAGNAVTFTAVVKNSGTAPTPAGVTNAVRFTINGSTVAWNYSFSSSIASGASVTLTANNGPLGRATWTAVAGYSKLQAKIDGNGSRITEIYESNNTRSRTFTVG